MVIIEKLLKRYGSSTVVSIDYFECLSGNTTVLLGPSGCGKSTLLRLVAGLIEANYGCIQIGGEVLTADNLRTIRHRMGYVIQEGGLFPHLTVQRNVVLMAQQLGWEKQAINRRFNELAELVQIPSTLFEQYPGELSGGQRQRVCLMRALMLNPTLLLLDEPLGALDPMIRYDLQQELKSIFAQLQQTVILVTHDLTEAVFFADTIVLMDQGKIIQQGDFQSLVRQPVSDFVKSFVYAQSASLSLLSEKLL